MNLSRHVFKVQTLVQRLTVSKPRTPKTHHRKRLVDPSHHGSTITDMRLPGALTCDAVEPVEKGWSVHPFGHGHVVSDWSTAFGPTMVSPPTSSGPLIGS